MYSHSSQIQAGSTRPRSEQTDRFYILTINGGSSSLKFALFAQAERPGRLLSGRVERIGMPGARLIVAEATGEQEDREVQAADQAAAVNLLIERLGQKVDLKKIAAVRVIPTDEESLIARAAAGFIPRSRESLAPAS